MKLTMRGFGFGVWFNTLGDMRFVTVAVGPFTIHFSRARKT